MSYVMDKEGKIKILVPGYSGGDMENPMTTQGDIIYGGAGGAPARLGIGAADQVLTVNAGATAPEWAAAAGGGDSTHTDTYANEPAASSNGDLFLPSDGFYLERDTGAAWAPWGPIFPMTKPPTAGWSWDNQGPATVDTTHGGICITAPAQAGVNLRVRYRTISAPYTVTAAFLYTMIVQNSSALGLCYRQSSDGKIVAFRLVADGGAIKIQVAKYTNSTTWSGSYAGIYTPSYCCPVFWMRIADNETNRVSSYSIDGQHWIQFHSVANNDFLTADQVGLFANSEQTTGPVMINALSWEES